MVVYPRNIWYVQGWVQNFLIDISKGGVNVYYTYQTELPSAVSEAALLYQIIHLLLQLLHFFLRSSNKKQNYIFSALKIASKCIILFWSFGPLPRNGFGDHTVALSFWERMATWGPWENSATHWMLSPGFVNENR